MTESGLLHKNFSDDHEKEKIFHHAMKYFRRTACDARDTLQTTMGFQCRDIGGGEFFIHSLIEAVHDRFRIR